MLKPGDRCVILPSPKDGDCAVYNGEIVKIVRLWGKNSWGTIWVTDLDDLCVAEQYLRKIDDDHDEIPADIRAIFDDKCDETLPEPSVHAEGGKE